MLRKLILALVPVLLLALVPATSHAGDVLGADRRDLSELPRQWFYKLGNGFINIGLGTMEIPFNSVSEINNALYEDRNPLVGSFTGALVGVGFTVARIATGIFEVATFPVSFNFEPIMRPETPWYLAFGRD